MAARHLADVAGGGNRLQSHRTQAQRIIEQTDLNASDPSDGLQRVAARSYARSVLVDAADAAGHAQAASLAQVGHAASAMADAGTDRGQRLEHARELLMELSSNPPLESGERQVLVEQVRMQLELDQLVEREQMVERQVQQQAAVDAHDLLRRQHGPDDARTAAAATKRNLGQRDVDRMQRTLDDRASLMRACQRAVAAPDQTVPTTP